MFENTYHGKPHPSGHGSVRKTGIKVTPTRETVAVPNLGFPTPTARSLALHKHTRLKHATKGATATLPSRPLIVASNEKGSNGANELPCPRPLQPTQSVHFRGN